MKRILNKIPSPPGALPARAQTWLLAGLTAVIAITLVTFPGQADKPRSAPSAKLETQGPGSPVGVRSVESAAQRMREEAARTAERRLRTELGVPPPREDGLPHPPVPVPAADDPYRTAGSGHAEAASAGEQIEREESIRRYRSLRTPPLVRSRRDEFAGKPAADGGHALLSVRGDSRDRAATAGTTARLPSRPSLCPKRPSRKPARARTSFGRGTSLKLS